MQTQTIPNDVKLVAKCGLYCGACSRYQKEKCPGCAQNQKAGWCKLRICCLENGYGTCAQCTEYADVMDCKKYNNFMSKLFGFIFNTNRSANIEQIKKAGLEAFATDMSQKRMAAYKKDNPFLLLRLF